MDNTTYISIDVHARYCVLGIMKPDGSYLGSTRFKTSERQLIRHVTAIEAPHKVVTLEEGPLAYFVSRILCPYVDDVLVCDPRKNRLISRNTHKCDPDDVHDLCRLSRLGELYRVYHPREDHRAPFKASVQAYLDFTRSQRSVKQKIKAKFRSWGVLEVDGQKVYSDRTRYLDLLQDEVLREQLEMLYAQLDALKENQKRSMAQMCRLGKRYNEIGEFMKMPGVGPVGAHVFDAYIQTPHRFSSRQQLWRYSALGVVHRSSDGKPIGRRRLDRSGNTVLKALSYRAWLGAMKTREPNEVRRYYEVSLSRTQNQVHARLNTQRKILTSLWTIWKHNIPYSATGFLGSCSAS